jgi:hypothetical protein
MRSPLRSVVLFLALATLVVSVASAEPRVGERIPTFSVDDLNIVRRTESDLRGWTITLIMTDKDASDGLTAWWEGLRDGIEGRATLLHVVAVDIFPLVPTSVVRSSARDRTPRDMWGRVWFSRDGELAEQLGLPSSETPWVIVIDPQRRVRVMVHADVSESGVRRVLAALPAPVAPPASPSTVAPVPAPAAGEE